MNIISGINRWVGKIAGPNAAHVLDGLVAFELTAAATASQSKSARDYAVHHPGVAVAFAFGPPVLTAVAAKFRKASAAKSAPAAAAPVAASPAPPVPVA